MNKIAIVDIQFFGGWVRFFGVLVMTSESNVRPTGPTLYLSHIGPNRATKIVLVLILLPRIEV